MIIMMWDKRKKYYIPLICLMFSSQTYLINAQERQGAGISFHVEDLSIISQDLHPTEANNVIERMLDNYAFSRAYELKLSSKDKYEILATSLIGNNIVSYDFNSFSKGMINAFAYHRAIVLSPDMIWLLITQAFGHYVNNNAEQMRPLLVSHDDIKTLTVVSEHDLLNEPDQVDWNVILDNFGQQIENYTNKNILKLLTADFTTTGQIEKIASQITLMEAVKSFFEYQVMYSVCGIPDITLLGTPGDWSKIREKASKLKDFGLDWWVNDLDPILEQFVRASEGDVDLDFWQGMVKKKRPDEVRFASCIPFDNNLTQFDGWFLKFYPFDMNGLTPEAISYHNEMLPEVVKVPFKYVATDTNGKFLNEYKLEFWSGFFGLKENPDNGSLTPLIGWMVCKVK